MLLSMLLIKLEKGNPFTFNVSYINSNVREHEANFMNVDWAKLFLVNIVHGEVPLQCVIGVP